MTLTPAQHAAVDAAVQAVLDEGDYGEVVIVLERGRLAEIRRTVSERVTREHGPPALFP